MKVGTAESPLPDRLLPLEATFKRHGSVLAYADWKSLREGRCRAVARKLRRRATVWSWVVGVTAALLVLGNLWRALADARDGRMWPWFAAIQAFLWAGLLLQAFLRLRGARELADRLDELGDAS